MASGSPAIARPAAQTKGCPHDLGAEVAVRQTNDLRGKTTSVGCSCCRCGAKAICMMRPGLEAILCFWFVQEGHCSFTSGTG
jgi:hypothetical protein